MTHHIQQSLLRVGKTALVIVFVLVATVYLVRATDSLGQQDLGPEHRAQFAVEFTARQESSVDWQRYQEIEVLLAEELQSKVDIHHSEERLLDRHQSSSRVHPESLDANWNYSYVASPASGRGVAVLLHGLTDSPYSMLATAGSLVGQGYHAVVPRMPGHGFAVGALAHSDWEDWAAAVRVAVRHAQTLQEPGQPFVLIGYSNGALLALHYALSCQNDGLELCPDSLIFLSPIEVTPFARLANLHHGLSWMPYFEKFAWQEILPEIDPFKFTSFPKHAGWQTYEFSRETHRLLADPDRASALPPILSFQSIVDDTVDATAVVSILYNSLPDNGSELVVYDANRSRTVLQLMSEDMRDPVEEFTELAPFNYSVGVVSNKTLDDDAVTIRYLAAGQSQIVESDLSLAWPTGVYSLSHIAIPFRADDILYGDGTNPNTRSTSRTILGAAAPRGERDVLALTPDYFLRLRHNPFYSYQAARIRSWLEELDL